GAPKANGSGTATAPLCPTSEKSVIPIRLATIVPMMIAIRMDNRDTVAMPTLLSSRTTTRVPAATARFFGSPQESEPSPPMAHPPATGNRLRPMVAITVPVTTGGKNLMILAKNGAINTPMTAATITEPKMVVMSPPPERMARIVATLANETPCTSGSCEPKNGNPTVCRMVARPPMNKHEAISRLIPVESSPAAFPTISGTAMMPPYMVRTCWRPYARLAPTPSRSSSGRFPLRTAVAEVIVSLLRDRRDQLADTAELKQRRPCRKMDRPSRRRLPRRPHPALADNSMSPHGTGHLQIACLQVAEPCSVTLTR